MSAVLGVDPGTRKSGYALLDAAGICLERGIVPSADLPDRIRELAAGREIAVIALGEGTHAAPVRAALEPLGLPIALVDERETTLRARALYFADHPPRGWRRLIPLGLQLPPSPIDDYAAILIGRRFLDRGNDRAGMS